MNYYKSIYCQYRDKEIKHLCRHTQDIILGFVHPSSRQTMKHRNCKILDISLAHGLQTLSQNSDTTYHAISWLHLNIVKTKLFIFRQVSTLEILNFLKLQPETTIIKN